LFTFTEQTAKSYLTTYLEEIWKPLLIYVQELFGPPITLTCFPSHTAIPTNEIKSYKDTHTLVHTQAKYDYITCPVLQTLQNLHPKFRPLMNDGFTTTLTVIVPKNPCHSFWQQQTPLEPKFQDTVSFEVRRWGQTKEQSYNHAIQRAADVIRYIRATVLGDSPKMAAFQFTTLSHSPISCSIFQLGAELYSMWKQSNEVFPGKDLEERHVGASRLLQTIQEKHDSDTYIYARPVLQYYKVYFLTSLVDIRPTSKWSLANLTTLPIYSRGYL
jgi:hypothetical protein